LRRHCAPLPVSDVAWTAIEYRLHAKNKIGIINRITRQKWHHNQNNDVETSKHENPIQISSALFFVLID
jgi:hypothetical protein